MRTKIVAAVLIALFAHTGAFAQSVASDAPIDGVAAPRREHPIALRDAVYVETETRHLAGRREAGASLQTPPAHRVRHPVLLGAVIGGATGFVLNATACGTGEAFCTSAGNLFMAGVGAGIGAFVGWLVAGR